MEGKVGAKIERQTDKEKGGMRSILFASQRKQPSEQNLE